MKAVNTLFISWICGAVAGSIVYAAETNSTPHFVPPSEVVHPPSIFDDKSSSMRDPFFPKSTRAPYVVAKPAATNAPPVAPPTFNLKGILGSGSHRLALINNQTLAEGESASVKSNGRLVRIRCLKIGERSATIIEEGKNEPVELHLQDR